MCNTELTKHFLSLQPSSGMMEETAYFNIVGALEKHFNGNWSWELVNETSAMDKSVVSATVTLYVPGRVYTGRATCPVKDFASVHLYALLDACSTFMKKANGIQTQNQSAGQQTGNMTAEQIMNTVNGTNGVNNAAQFYNHKDENNVHSGELPFNSMTQNATQEIQQEMGMGNAMNPPQNPPQNTQPNNDEYNMPNANLGGYSQSQVDRMNEFKKNWDVANNDQFSNYVRMWHPGFTKKDLNPNNIEDFLAWTKRLGKQPS